MLCQPKRTEEFARWAMGGGRMRQRPSPLYTRDPSSEFENFPVEHTTRTNKKTLSQRAPNPMSTTPEIARSRPCSRPPPLLLGLLLNRFLSLKLVLSWSTLELNCSVLVTWSSWLQCPQRSVEIVCYQDAMRPFEALIVPCPGRRCSRSIPPITPSWCRTYLQKQSFTN